MKDKEGGDGMNDLRKSAEMALEFVSWFASDDHSVRPKHKAPEIAEALRQALAQPEQVPFEYWNAVEGWVKIDEVRQHFDSVGCGTIYKTAGEDRVPLYAAPYTKLDTTAGVLHKEWVGLTDEELSLLWLEYHADNFIADGRIINYEKAIEAKLKEKNG